MEPRIHHRYLYFIGSIAAFGGFNSGINMSVMTGAAPFMKEAFQLSDNLFGFTIACISIGALLGALSTHRITSKIGRKKTFQLAAAVIGLSSLLQSIMPEVPGFILMRILLGVGIGLSSIVSPMYLAEISPSHLRGTMVTLYQFAIVSGILTAYFTDVVFLSSGPSNWRWMLGTASISSFLYFFLIGYLPRSPRWLIAHKKDDEAWKVLRKIGNDSYAQAEYAQIKNSLQHEVKASMKDLLKPGIPRIILIGSLLCIFQQWSGTNLIFTYAPFIFQEAGLAIDDSVRQIIIIGIVNFLFTIPALWLIEKLGRKTLLLTGGIGLMICLASLSAAFRFQWDGFIILILSLSTIACFAMTLGPVVWVVISEISPGKVKVPAMAVYTFFIWFSSLLGAYSFPPLLSRMGTTGIFLVYAGLCLLFTIFTLKYVPETRGKSLEEIESLLLTHNNNPS